MESCSSSKCLHSKHKYTKRNTSHSETSLPKCSERAERNHHTASAEQGRDCQYSICWWFLILFIFICWNNNSNIILFDKYYIWWMQAIKGVFWVIKICLQFRKVSKPIFPTSGYNSKQKFDSRKERRKKKREREKMKGKWKRERKKEVWKWKENEREKKKGNVKMEWRKEKREKKEKSQVQNESRPCTFLRVGGGVVDDVHAVPQRVLCGHTRGRAQRTPRGRTRHTEEDTHCTLDGVWLVVSLFGYLAIWLFICLIISVVDLLFDVVDIVFVPVLFLLSPLSALMQLHVCIYFACMWYCVRLNKCEYLDIMFKYGHADYTYPRIHRINVSKVCESANKDCVKETEMTKMENS